jgi:hypothetical protein
MVELASAPYDDDSIPFVMASVVYIDAELSEDSIVTAEVVPVSPDNSAHSSGGIPPFTVDPFPSEREASTEPDPYMVTTEQVPQQQDEETKRNVAAGTAGAVIGLFIGGPVISLVLGLGTAYYVKQPGAAGDLARALGDVALVARDKFREVDSEHHIIEQSRAAAKEALQKLQEADRRQGARDKLGRFAVYCWRSTLDFVERHNLVERAGNGLMLIAAYLASKVEAHHRRVCDRAPRQTPHDCHDSQRRSTRR